MKLSRRTLTVQSIKVDNLELGILLDQQENNVRSTVKNYKVVKRIGRSIEAKENGVHESSTTSNQDVLGLVRILGGSENYAGEKFTTSRLQKTLF